MISAVSTRAVIGAAARRGVDPDELLRPHGLTQAQLDDPDARLPAQQVGQLWQSAAQAAKEPELAVLAAVELPWRSYRVLDYLAGSAASVGEALGLVSRYFRIVNDTVQLQIEEGDGGRLRLVRADGEALPAPYVDYALAACVYRMSYVSEGVVHGEVWLRRAAPRDLTGHHRAFGAQLHFGADRDEVWLPDVLWRRPTTAADPVLRDLLEAHAQELLRQLASREDPLADLRSAALEAMRAGRPDLAWVARKMEASVRTLQRRLAAEGTGWRELLEGLRQEAAREYLGDPALSVDDVAVLLGYAEASTFHRAFRRWTGHSPGAWRQSRRAKIT